MSVKSPVASSASRGPLGYRVAKSILGRPLRVLYDLRVEGLGHLPAEGPAILAANHRSFMGSLFLALSSPRLIAFLAKADYFDHRVTRWLLRGSGQIPLRRGSPKGTRRALS